MFRRPRRSSWFGENAESHHVAESDGEFTITMDLPGFEEDDIDLRVTDHTLHVEAECESEEESEYLRGERRRRSVSRTVRLPADVDRERAEASCKQWRGSS